MVRWGFSEKNNVGHLVGLFLLSQERLFNTYISQTTRVIRVHFRLLLVFTNYDADPENLGRLITSSVRRHSFFDIYQKSRS